jgi:hypothetical protein
MAQLQIEREERIMVTGNQPSAHYPPAMSRPLTRLHVCKPRDF